MHLKSFLTSLLPLFVLAHFTHHVITAIASPLLPLIRSSFSLSYTQSGLLLSSFTLAYGLGHLPSGWLSDRLGAPIMMFIGIVGVGFSGLLVGLAPSFSLLLAANFLVGVSGSGYHPSASSLIARVVKPEQRGGALGVHVIGGSASYFVAPLLAGALSTALGWRGTYLTLSIPTMLLGFALLLLLNRATGRRGISRTGEAGTVRVAAPRGFWVWMPAFLALSTLTGALVGSAVGFLPLLLVDSYGVRESAAAGLLAIVFSGGFWAAPLAGLLSDRIGKLPMLLAASVIAAPTVFLLPRVPPGPGLYALFVLVGLFIFVRMPVSESFIVSRTPPGMRSTLLGVYFLGSSAGGGAFTPLLGWFSDRHGFQAGFTAAALAVLLLTAVCGAILLASRRAIGQGEGERTGKEEPTSAA